MKQTAQNKEKQSFLIKLENFWYYYKVPVILGIIFLAGLLILLPSPSERVVSDLKMTLVSEGILNEDSINFNEALPGLIQDINDDGESNITISRIFLSKDLTEENAEAYHRSLEAQLSNRGATLFIFDAVNYERMVKKDAFCPLDELLDTSLYSDRVLYRDEVPIAMSLKGSKVLADMNFLNDDLYAMVLFRRPGEENEPERVKEYENAVLVLKALVES